MEYVAYILYSRDFDKIYIGYTSNMIQRIFSHNNAHKGYTIKYRPWTVVHIEFYESQKEAMKREKSLKGGQGRQWIYENLNKNNGLMSFHD